MRVAYIGNQGGPDVYRFYAEMARAVAARRPDVLPVFAVWLDRERDDLVAAGWPAGSVHSFESWVRGRPPPDEADVARLRRDYPDINWSEVVAAERSFTDYSMLLGAAGERRADLAYVVRLVSNVVGFLEQVLSAGDVGAAVCQTADTLFSLAAAKLARHRGVRVFAINPAWLLEPGGEGGFFVNNEYLESDRMREGLRRLAGRALTPAEIERTDRLIAGIRSFANKTSFHQKNKGARAGLSALSPNVGRLIGYLRANAARDPDVEYNKIDPWRKLRANLLRLWRKRATAGWLGPKSVDAIPPRSVFFAIHYQPEQSTLAQGIWHVNQVAVIENISKALPLGYMLVVKEHPWGRGNRPLWVYRHLAGFYNVMFCDAPAKEIVQRVEAVIAISGTIGIESLVLGKPTVVLGRSFFTHADLLYRAHGVRDLPDVLMRILVDRDYERQPDRELRLRRFLLAYLEAMIPWFPTVENGRHWGAALADELGPAAEPQTRPHPVHEAT